MNNFVRKFTSLVFLAFFAGDAFSLSSDVLSRKFEDRARRALERFVPAKDFQVSVTVTSKKEKKPTVPYDPRGSRGSVLESSTIEELNQHVEKVGLELLISKRLSNSKEKLVDILFKELKLNGRRGDKISFGVLGIELAPEAWEKEKLDLKRQLEALEGEREKLNRDLLSAKLEKQQVSKREMAQEEPKKIEQVEKQDPFWKEFVTENARYLQFLTVGIIFACLSVIVLVAMAARSAYSTRKRLAEGFDVVANAMSTIAGAIGSSSSTSSREVSGAPSLLEAKLQGQLPGAASATGSGGTGYSLRTMQSHILQKQKEMLESINPQTEPVLVQYLMTVAAHPFSISKAAVTLELLGKEKAVAIFNQLGVHTQEIISQFFRTGQFEKPKHELMIDVVEELKTKFLAVTLQGLQSPRNERVASQLLQLAEEDLLHLIVTLDDGALPRLFMYLEPKKIALLLHQLKTSDLTNFSVYVKALAKMSEYQTRFELDEVLEEALQGVLQRSRADIERPFLKRYQEIVEIADEELTDQLIRELPKNSRVLEYLNTHAITMHTLFLLKSEAKISILRELSNEEIGSLCYHFADRRKEIISLFAPKRRETILHHLEAIAGQGGGHLEELYGKAKITILQELKSMQKQGLLAENLDTSSDEEAA